jgi:hypothetical protein
MAEKASDLKGTIKTIKHQYQSHIVKAQLKSEADAELLELLREYAQVL